MVSLALSYCFVACSLRLFDVKCAIELYAISAIVIRFNTTDKVHTVWLCGSVCVRVIVCHAVGHLYELGSKLSACLSLASLSLAGCKGTFHTLRAPAKKNHTHTQSKGE